MVMSDRYICSIFVSSSFYNIDGFSQLLFSLGKLCPSNDWMKQIGGDNMGRRKKKSSTHDHS